MTTLACVDTQSPLYLKYFLLPLPALVSEFRTVATLHHLSLAEFSAAEKWLLTKSSKFAQARESYSKFALVAAVTQRVVDSNVQELSVLWRTILYRLESHTITSKGRGQFNITLPLSNDLLNGKYLNPEFVIFDPKSPKLDTFLKESVDLQIKAFGSSLGFDILKILATSPESDVAFVRSATRLIGSVFATSYHTKSGARISYIFAMAREPEAARHGIATRLMNKLVTRLKTRDVDYIAFHTAVANTPMKSLVTKMGFREKSGSEINLINEIATLYFMQLRENNPLPSNDEIINGFIDYSKSVSPSAGRFYSLFGTYKVCQFLSKIRY